MPYTSKQDQAASAAKHYALNADKVKARAREWTTRQRRLLADLSRRLRDVPCAECGDLHPYYVMQFDHVRVAAETEPSLF